MPSRVALSFLLLAIGAVQAQAVTLQHAYRFSARVSVAEGRLVTAPTHDSATFPKAGAQGVLELLSETVTFLVPRGSQLAGVRGVAIGEHVVEEGVTLQLATPVAGATNPAPLVEPAGSGALHGYQMESVRVYPVRWDAGGEALERRRAHRPRDRSRSGRRPPHRPRSATAPRSKPSAPDAFADSS